MVKRTKPEETLVVVLKEIEGEEEVGILVGEEVRLTPKPSSTGPKGTIFYNSNDDHIYVATE